MNSAQIRNWDGSRTWQPETIVRPADEDEIATLIRRAADEGKRLKPLGSALSWSDIIDIPSIAIQFDNMAEVLEVDRDRRRIRLQVGVPLERVNEVLADHSLALDNFGSIVKQTAGGYIATGSHGTGIRTPILSNYIERMRLIDGLGQVHELDAENEPELFSAARVNLGCLGVVSEMTIRCVEAFDLEERLDLIDFDTALADLGTILQENDYCKLWWLPYTGKIQVYAFNKTSGPRRGAGLSGFLDETGVSGALFTGLIALGRAFPGAIPFIHNAVQAIHYRPHRRSDRSDKVIKVSTNIPIHQETEYAIPVERAAEAIDKTRQLTLNAEHRANFPLEVRFVAADDIPLSPASGRDSCFIGPYVASTKWAPLHFAAFEEMIADYDGRPHWGKDFSLGGERLRQVYPDYDAFNRLRQQCDPQGVFRNTFVDRVFPE